MTLCNKGYAKRLYLLLLVSWHFPAKILQNLDTSHLLSRINTQRESTEKLVVIFQHALVKK
ncbi:Uncharacterised protein [Legionella pneumophila]|nr:Uncharacterised protein [Legionella pneumophila]